MSEGGDFHLAKAPIIEAVLDIDCDLPVGTDLVAMEQGIRERFAGEYPKFQRQMVQQHQFKASTEPPAELSVAASVQSLQFLKEDGRQLVQVRRDGFSFNRLAPYSSLDDYLPEIERMWLKFVDAMSPVQIRSIGLRFINRLFLPTSDGFVNLGEYLFLDIQRVAETGLELSGFFNQYSATEVETGHQVNRTLVAQLPDSQRLPVIFDIEAMDLTPLEPKAWDDILGTIVSLRRLKNKVFRGTLTEQCLNLFR
jgi:uncharacterized protein (TIGR04255 family)